MELKYGNYVVWNESMGMGLCGIGIMGMRLCVVSILQDLELAADLFLRQPHPVHDD